MLISFTNPDVPIIDIDIDDYLDWVFGDDIECQNRDTDTEEQHEIHHLRYKES